MLQKEKIIQAQNLQLLNDNQGRALSALECYTNDLIIKIKNLLF